MLPLRKSSVLLALVLVFALSALALGQATPSVTVQNQTIQNSTVTVQQVVAAEPGWIVIHADAAGKPGVDIGHAAVAAGTNNLVVVNIDETRATPTLYAMLHVDKGTPGTYEFPGADIPVQVNGRVVSVPFQIISLPGAASATPASGAATAATSAAGASVGALQASGTVTVTATTTVPAAATSAPTTAAATTAPTATTAPAATTASTAAAVAPTTAAAAVAATAAPAGTAVQPGNLPTTGGSQVNWLAPVLGFVALFFVAGLGLTLARRAR